jgi:hypothetical protein
MLILLRIVAFLTMFLALVEAGLITYDQLRDDDKRSTTTSSTSSERSVNENLSRAVGRYLGPLTLFCTGAMLYVVIRISATQEDDVQAQSFADAAASGRGRP